MIFFYGILDRMSGQLSTTMHFSSKNQPITFICHLLIRQRREIIKEAAVESSCVKLVESTWRRRYVNRRCAGYTASFIMAVSISALRCYSERYHFDLLLSLLNPFSLRGRDLGYNSTRFTNLSCWGNRGGVISILTLTLCFGLVNAWLTYWVCWFTFEVSTFGAGRDCASWKISKFISPFY